MSRDRNKFDEDCFRPRNDEERSFCRLFDVMFDADAVLHGFARSVTPVKELVRQFFDRVESKGDEGYRLAGQLLREEVESRGPQRTLLSLVLTSMARRFVDEQSPRTYEDAQGKERPMYPESRVHHVGRVLASMLQLPPGTKSEDDRVIPAIVAWCEDMGNGIVEGGKTVLERQETSIIRGALFASSVDHRVIGRFWDQALDSTRFPWRIFSDPCHSERGQILSTQHAVAIGTIMNHASEAAARRIAGQMIEHTTRRCDEVRSHDKLSYDKVVPATAHDRQTVFGAILDNVRDPERRTLVRELFRPVLQP